MGKMPFRVRVGVPVLVLITCGQQKFLRSYTWHILPSTTVAQFHGSHTHVRDIETVAHLQVDVQLTTTHTMADDSDEDPPPEWIAHTDHIHTLWSLADPLHHILANIEERNGTICSLGKLLEDEHERFTAMIDVLIKVAGTTADPIVTLLELMAYAHLPTLILNMHAACRVIAHACLQVQSYPDLVDHWAVPCNAGADFHVPDPPATVPDHTLDTDTSGETGTHTG